MTELQEKIISLIKSNPNGISANDIAMILGVEEHTIKSTIYNTEICRDLFSDKNLWKLKQDKPKPRCEDYGLTKAKILLLDNPQKHEQLKINKEHLLHHNQHIREYQIIWTSIIITIIIAILLIYFSENKKTMIGFVIFFGFMIPIPFVIIYGILDLLFGNIKDIKNYREGIWELVPITDEDRDNYYKYKADLDEYERTEINILWDDVTFQNNFVQFPIKCRGNNVIKIPCKSKLDYAKYKDTCKSNFKELRVISVDGHYKLIDESVITDALIIIIKHIELLEQEAKQRIENFLNSNAEFRRAHNNQPTIIIDIQARKSDYLNYLYKNQAPNKDIIPATERCIYATSSLDNWEKAYIFTLPHGENRYYLIYENVNESTASIVCDVLDGQEYYDCVKAMYDYMHSNKVNKRETQRSLHKIANFTTRSIIHTDLASWLSSITGRSETRRKTIIRYHSHHRRHYYAFT